MGREVGYYWVCRKIESEWCVAYWDGQLFLMTGTLLPTFESCLDIDERRIVRGHQRRIHKASQRDVDLTSRVLRGDTMTNLAKQYGLSPPRVRSIVWRTLQKRNPRLYAKLTSDNPDQSTPTVFDVRKYMAEFGFSVQPDGTVDTSKEG